MKTRITILLLLASTTLTAQDKSPGMLETKTDATGPVFTIEFEKGGAHNHPLMAFWVEDTAGNYIETLYVAQSIATSVYKFGEADKGVWEAGTKRRPAALPYWGHKRGVKAKDGLYIPHPDNPMPDAVTGPTPKDDFTLRAKADTTLTPPFKILMEINQPWDWNEHWTNTKFPNDEEYKSSAQPAVVYAAKIKSLEAEDSFKMQIIGRSHQSGKNGKLYKDLETMTSAKNIAESITIKIGGDE